MKPHITAAKVRELKCFPQVAGVLGEKRAVLELMKVLSVASDFSDSYHVSCCFVWDSVSQGYSFWSSIEDGRLPS